MLRHTYNHHNFLDAFEITTAAPGTFTSAAWILGLLLSMAALFLYTSHQAFLLEQAMKLPHEHENENQDDNETEGEEQGKLYVEQPPSSPPQQPQAVSFSCRAAAPPLPRRVTNACNMSLPLSAVPAF